MNESTAQLLLRLQQGESEAIKEVYRQAYPACAKLILDNSGSIEDAKDLFQEVLMVFLKKLRQADFELTASINTFLYAICRNLWLKQLRKRRKKPIDLVLDKPENSLPLVQVDSLEEKKELEAKHEHISDQLAGFKKDCRQLLVAFYYKKLPLKEIAARMDYTYNFIKVKKKRCMDKFKSVVLESWENSSN